MPTIIYCLIVPFPSTPVDDRLPWWYPWALLGCPVITMTITALSAVS
ncbi:hypothetical protein [Actinomadura yumaensis]|uniref:Uncharacterized protein n=1 Tax=Actinomadura yumaensis TaxID=111807 RepID=A0ABW2CNY1_9ACTN